MVSGLLGAPEHFAVLSMLCSSQRVTITCSHVYGGQSSLFDLWRHPPCLIAPGRQADGTGSTPYTLANEEHALNRILRFSESIHTSTRGRPHPKPHV